MTRSGEPSGSLITDALMRASMAWPLQVTSRVSKAVTVPCRRACVTSVSMEVERAEWGEYFDVSADELVGGKSKHRGHPWVAFQDDPPSRSSPSIRFGAVLNIRRKFLSLDRTDRSSL